MEDDSILILIESSFYFARTIVSAFVIPESMLTVRALKLPSLLGFCEMREREGNGVNNAIFDSHILLFLSIIFYHSFLHV